MWVVKGSKFYNRSMKSFLQNNNIEIYSTHNELKSVVLKDSLNFNPNQPGVF